MRRSICFIAAFAWTASALAQPALPSDKARPERAANPERAAKAPSAAAGGTVRERQDPAEAQRLFRELDRNGDGYLTADELWSRPGQDANWAAADRDGDGRISPGEFTVLRR